MVKWLKLCPCFKFPTQSLTIDSITGTWHVPMSCHMSLAGRWNASGHGLPCPVSSEVRSTAALGELPPAAPALRHLVLV